jgi:hypothetical protein
MKIEYDFFTEVGTPELTRLFCEVDREFFPRAFPDLRFYRGDSWENTIAYGKNQCEFIFETKQNKIDAVSILVEDVTTDKIRLRL